MMKRIKVYLDTCCYNRPFDDQSRLIVELETKAKLFIQSRIISGNIDLVVSYMSYFENSENPEAEKRYLIDEFFRYRKIYIGESLESEVFALAAEIMKTGIREKDAIHVASGILGGADYFITTDKRLLKYQTDRIRVVNPLDFVREYGEQQ